MAETKIEWSDATWNPVAGCSVVSAGCKNCYAMEMAWRLERMGVEKYNGIAQKVNNNAVWTGKVLQDYKALETPYRWRSPRRIFVNSMSDLFHPDVTDEFIHKVWRVMSETPRHYYQILTKRPERMQQVVSDQIQQRLPNVWLGVTVENADAKWRLDYLRETPAAIRFVSFEPLIAPVGDVNLSGIHWAIVGGESGKNARPISEAWVDEIHQQCSIDDVAFFFKQWGTWGKDQQRRSKKANGRTYRGRTWNEMPTNTLQS